MLKVCTSCPLLTSHNLIVLSLLDEATYAPSPEKATAVTLPLCPLRVCKRSTRSTVSAEITARASVFVLVGETAAPVGGTDVVIAAGEEVASVAGGDTVAGVERVTVSVTPHALKMAINMIRVTGLAKHLYMNIPPILDFSSGLAVCITRAAAYPSGPTILQKPQRNESPMQHAATAASGACGVSGHLAHRVHRRHQTCFMKTYCVEQLGNP